MDSSAGESAAPAFNASAFRNEMTSLIRSELGNGISGIRRELEERFSQQSAPEEKIPSMKDYLGSDGQMNEESFEKFMDARLKHALKGERAGWEKEFESNQSRLRTESEMRKTQNEHLSRESEYEKTNPNYRQDLINAGDMEVNPSVGQRILASKYSANIIHHFAKNRGDFMRFQAMSYDNPVEALEYLGELGAQFKTASQPRKTPATPTRGAFGGVGAGKSTGRRSTKEILDEWNG